MSEGNVDVKEFHNLLFQSFFKDCHWGDFQWQQKFITIAQETTDGKFEININIQPEKSGEYPTRDDRNVFYRLLSKVGDHSVNRYDWENSTFKLAAGEKTTIAAWLKKLSRTTAEIAAVSINREGFATVRKLPNLRIIDEYEITEIDSSNFFKVRIEFGEWIRRGYNEQILDAGLYPLLTQPISLKSKHIVTGV